MSENGLKHAQEKMRGDGLPEASIKVFTDYYHQLESGQTGLIREDSIEPLLDPPMLEDVEIDDAAARAAFDQTVIIKLNGGLGTSMGLDRAKNLLPVRDGLTFLDIIVRQVLSAREKYGARLPLLFMNSFRTAEDTEAALSRYDNLPVDGLPLGFLQSREPKLLADTLEPVEWPADPSLEWCPPGHGDLYIALSASGILDRLVEAGYRYACVANGDNLGSAPNPRLAGWFAQSGAPYAAEVCRRTVNDRKGGHLAIRKADNQLILRDTAQTAPEEMDFFTDEHRHPFFHTNNLWFDLRVLQQTLRERDSVLGLPMIRNEKTVDPADKTSPKVVQIESAMGAAVEVFEGATAICVGRDRFQPVKTTNELLLLRSDLYELDADYLLQATTDHPVEVSLDGDYFKLVGDFDERMPDPVSLRRAESFTVKGDWRFGKDVSVEGEVLLETQEPASVDDGTVLRG
ncbi:UTP--glucose-1-phosphate uridylyltransferase [Aestuariimicrobium sp. p3-SID1156]|uniref:UTP--glucose-1-phosphate uridylyltransferase n=1 Tax=Aestuariimicrobium sp. p3-SID1156 TaxID=2916038 RepID=UPI00223A7F90|nr:UTP--glucose-1-phosphate uridylyltransferase [Aestuariimicrobium sp. p3-SID1156]MCT1458457.1 UTP--glucose-1-phosphate uridylyltransferase [Aestuariimicrobium sp. p3-SID1156]